MNDKKHNIEFKKKSFLITLIAKYPLLISKKKSRKTCVSFSLSKYYTNFRYLGLKRRKFPNFLFWNSLKPFFLKMNTKKSCLKIQYIPR